MNQCEVDGIIYEARPVAYSLHERPCGHERACLGCAGNAPSIRGLCSKLPACYAVSRADAREIIWVEAKGKDETR